MELNIKPWTKEGIEEREKATFKQKDKSDPDSEEELQEVDNEPPKKIEEEKKEFEEDVQEMHNEQVQHQDDKAYLYEAVGVVVHSGGAEGGHYYSFVKDRHKGKWFEFNDTNVKPFDIKDLPEETFGGESKRDNFLGNVGDFIGEAVFSRSKNAYFIIYQKKFPDPYETIQLNDPAHEYVKGIPKSIYQHIWDENMLFIKRMYFFDSEYLHFIREFLNLNNFERQLYTNASSLTKPMRVKKEAANILGITKESLKVQTLGDIDMFDVEFNDNDKMETNLDFYPEKDIKESQNVGESSLNEENDNKIMVDTKNIDPSKVNQAKQLLLNAKNKVDREEYIQKLEKDLKENPALYMIKFSTLFALKIKDHAKDSFSFISLLQQLNSMYEMHADGCMWLLKYLTFNPQMVIEHLLKNKSEEERENFRALLITAISLAAKNEEKDFFENHSQNYSTEVIVEFDEEKNVFKAEEIPKAVIIRFMQVFFENMLDTAREYFQNYEDYFQVLFYFARLGYMETKYLVQAKGIFKLLDFVMNNSPPFHHDRNRKKMGNALCDPHFATPIDIFSYLIRSCSTKGSDEVGSSSPVSIAYKPDEKIELPFDEIKFMFNRLCFTIEMINKQYNNSITEILLHLCWGDVENSRFFLKELIFSLSMRTNASQNQRDILKNISAILQLQDSYEDQRMEIVCGLEEWTQENPDEEPTTFDRNTLTYLGYSNVNDRQWYALKILYYLSEACCNQKVAEYMEKHKSKLNWIRSVIEYFKTQIENSENRLNVDFLESNQAIELYASMTESVINTFSNFLFPDLKDGFRGLKAKSDQSFREETNNQEGCTGFNPQAEPEVPINPDRNSKRTEFEGADDDFMNVACADSGKPTQAPGPEAPEKRGIIEVPSIQNLNNSFS